MNTVRIYESFDDLPKTYDALFDDASKTFGLFSSLPWFRNMAATVCDDGQRLRIYCIESAQGIFDSGFQPGVQSEYQHEVFPCLALPMRHATVVHGPFKPRMLDAYANFYTSLFNPVIRAPDKSLQEHIGNLANAIAADRPRWDIVNLYPMDAGSALFNSTIAAFRRSGMAVQTYFCFVNWYLEVNGRTFQEYFDALPSRLKNTVTRRTRQFEKSGHARLEIISGMEDVACGIAAYEKVYAASWKGKEAYPAFMAGLLQTCAEQGWLRLGIAYLDDVPIAAQLWIVVNGVASIYKLAYDEQYSRWSAGTILTARLMRHVIDIDKVREVDYLTGDDAYKKDWMSNRRERHGIMAFNLRTMNGMLAACRHIGGRLIKDLLRRLPR